MNNIKYNRIGVVGSGAMGVGIAQVCASAGAQVLVYDHDASALERGRQNQEASVTKLLAKFKISPEEAQQIRENIQYVDDLTAFNDRDVVIEAIIEDLAVKQALFVQLESIVQNSTILASNTSSLSITAIASACSQPERVLGIHFFNPAPLMVLVEVIPALQSRAGLAEDMRNWVDSLGKLPVVVKDTPGFIVNRVARPYYSEALRILEEGIADIHTIDRVMTERGGFRMGPFQLMDFIGHDVNYRVTHSMYEAFFHEARYKPSLTQKSLFDAGFYGRKSGRGFYTYSESGQAAAPNQVEESSPQVSEQLFLRILVMLINEAAEALYYGIATRDDIDLAMTTGVNYPKGLLQWADEIGAKRIQEVMDALYEYYHEERYRLSPLLRMMASSGQKFYE